MVTHKIGAYLSKDVVCNERTSMKEEFAATINNLIRQALKNNWGEQYVNALYDIQKLMGLKGTVYELIV